jgi:hypothetical protein
MDATDGVEMVESMGRAEMAPATRAMEARRRMVVQRELDVIFDVKSLTMK